MSKHAANGKGNAKAELRVPQARVLNALLSLDKGATLTRTNLAERAGFNPTTGMINRVLHGIPKGSSSGEAHPGLLELGYVIRTDPGIDGVRKANYQITDKGIEVVTRYLKEKKRTRLP
jgi:hypothetical protein